MLSVVGIASVGGIGLTYYWRKNNGKPNSRTPRQPPPQSSAGDFDSVRSLIGETEGVLKKALNDAVATNDSLWLGALRFLKEELSDLSRRIELGTIAYAEARVRILDLRKRVDSLRNPPRREPVGAEPKSAAMKDLPMEELVDIILNVSRNADGYDVLGVSRGASKEDIDTAFKQKQHGWHPDKFPSANDKKLANAVSTRLNNAKDQIYKERGWK